MIPTRDELISLYDACLRANDGRLLLEGVAARADTPTANGRAYPAAALRRVARLYARSAVERGVALGELDHPSYNSPLYRRVSLANASHVVVRLEWRKRRGGVGELRAVAEVLPTPSGILLWQLASLGAPLALSQRCWAEVEWHAPRGREGSSGGVQHVCGATLELLAFDFVPDPANAGAWMRPVARREEARRLRPSGASDTAVALAHLGVGSVLAEEAAEMRGLPPPRVVIEALLQRRAATTAAGAAASRPLRVGALHVSESHYCCSEHGGQDEGNEEKEAQLAALVASAAGASAGGGGPVRALPSHWRRFAERALECEARERERQGCGDEDDGCDGGEPAAAAAPGCWSWLWWWRQRRGRRRGRRRRSLEGRAESAAIVHPLCPPAAAGEDGAPEVAAAAAARALEVDAVLWDRAAKARDVRRAVLLPMLPPPP